jgi:hypothetical protein
MIILSQSVLNYDEFDLRITSLIHLRQIVIQLPERHSCSHSRTLGQNE